MKTLLNIIWFLLAGLPMAIGYFVAGLVLAVTIVGIPFAIAAFRLASYSLWPFGRTVVNSPVAGAGSAVGNLLWVLLAGWWLALAHLASAAALAVTIIGIPLAIAEVKLIPLALFPMGKQIIASRNAVPYQYGRAA
ncbi:MAG: YccF domain-containing protein [Promicromonosporaceae bacterium]|nr:YccF domain-containing protein [Promicromonosporaceae bacterium]